MLLTNPYLPPDLARDRAPGAFTVSVEKKMDFGLKNALVQGAIVF